MVNTNRKNKIVFLLSFFILISLTSCFVYAGDSIFYWDLTTANNTLYWQGHTGTDGSWLTGLATTGNTTAEIFGVCNNNTFRLQSEQIGNTTAQIQSVQSQTGNTTKDLEDWWNENRTNGNNYLKKLGIGSGSAYTGLLNLYSTGNADIYLNVSDSTWRMLHAGTTHSFQIQTNGTAAMTWGSDGNLKFVNPYGNTFDVNYSDVAIAFNLVSTGASNSANINWYRGIANKTWAIGLTSAFDENLLFQNDGGIQLKLDYQGNATFSRDVIANKVYAKDINISRNAFINNIYGEMNNWTDGGAVYTPTGIGVYHNLTGMKAGLIYGFTFGTRTQANGGDYLQAQYDGVYKIDAKLTIRIGTGALYGFGVVNNSENPERTGDCYSRRSGDNTWTTIPITCFRRLNVNDNISLVFDDESTPVKTLEIERAEINILRIGNL